MIRFLLDTDHVSLQERAHPLVLANLRSHRPETLGVSIVTVQQSLRGRLAALQRKLPSALVVQAYQNLQETVGFFLSVNIVPFTALCEQKFLELHRHRLRIGTLDLRIAATALVHDFTLVTANRKHFSPIPDLRIEDWSAP